MAGGGVRKGIVLGATLYSKYFFFLFGLSYVAYGLVRAVVLAAGRGTVVQNSLDGQAISTHTIISSSVNSMSLLKDMNFQAGLRDAGIRAIGTH